MVPNVILMPAALEGSPRSEQPETSAPEPTRPGDGPGRRPLSEDDVFDALRAGRRREALRYLDANGGEASLGTIAEHVAAVENDIAPAAVTADQRKRVYIALHQCHLPKLADLGVVEYDDRDPVRLLPAARRPLPYLYFDPDDVVLGNEEPTGPLAPLRRWWRRFVDW